MSIITSAFDLTGSYLASCVVALDAHQLKIQSVDPSSANAISHSFTLDKDLKVTFLVWGLLANATNSKLESQYIAICLNNGSILIYSPVQNQVVSTLESITASAVVSFYHSQLTGTAFSIDVKGEINEWDLINYKVLRCIKIPQLTSNNEQTNRLITIMHNNEIHLLIASYSIFLVALKNLNEVIFNFPGHVNPVHTILSIGQDLFLTAADNDRFINVFSVSKRNIEKVLVCQSNVTSVSFGETQGKSIVIAVTEDNVELFNNPLLIAQDTNGSAASKFSKKKKVKSKSKTSDALIKIARPLVNNPTAEILKINLTFVFQNKFIVTWLESPAIPFFETLIWYDDSCYVLSGVTELIKAKPTIKLNDHSLHGHDLASSKHYNESNAIVQMGDNFKDLEGSEDDEETLAEKMSKLADPSIERSKEKRKKATTGTVTTILTQAIKSNDHALLETVLNNKDDDVVKNTIKKMSINYVIPLLNRISERIARNSSKQSTLNIWIKWLFIIHGGFLNSYSNLTQNLGILHSTLHRRSLTLTRLLELNGKIDMVLENMELKKMILKTNANSDYGVDGEENDSDVEYIEELEDNGLEIDEESEIDDDEKMDDYVESDEYDDEVSTSSEAELELKDVDDNTNEDNYSDEEIAVKKINADLDSDLEEELELQKKIRSLKKNPGIDR